MQTEIFMMALWIFVAGGIGGAVNALMTDNGFMLPRSEVIDEHKRIFRPGFLGNILIGAVGAAISWGLYGPAGAIGLLGGPATAAATPVPALTVAALVGALLVGVTGARWLTNEVDKSLLKAAASRAANAAPSSEAAQRMAGADPVETLHIAQAMPAR